MQGLRAQAGRYARIQWLLGILLLAGIAVFYLAGWRPRHTRLAALQGQIESGRREIALLREERTRQDARREAVSRLQAKLRGYGKKLPRQLELGQFMNDLTQVGQQSSLRNFTVVPGGSKRMELFFEQPISLNFEGDFMHAALFLRQIEDLQRITRVRRLHMRSRDEKTGLVEVELTMNIYFSEI